MDEQFAKLIDELRQLHAAVPTTGRVPWTRTVPGEAFASAAFAAMPELLNEIKRLIPLCQVLTTMAHAAVLEDPEAG